jgi:serine/threonine protein kinase
LLPPSAAAGGESGDGAGPAAEFGGPAEGPRSCLDASQRPALLKQAAGESDHVVKPKSDAMPAPGQTGDRYQLFGEIARGGMGAVLRGRDVDLGRDLAVKVLLDKHAGRPEVVRRFIEEAQIGGQLQHPGVVPVYDIGHFGARPFFTMKLVKGQTLAALLSKREVGHVSNVPEESAARWKRAPQDLPRFLSIALQVCQAVAYAHAKGVIHRALKPANVMVGAFGEVQVMDWGLAKVLKEGGIADEEKASRERERPEDITIIRTARSSGSAGTDTEGGSLLGTPAYMSPEQANGDVVHLDRRADVFGLGAILCEVLTGKPPYVGRSGEEVRRKAANGDLADATARLDDCGADPELIALTNRCLSPEPIDRPSDAQEVADGRTAYQSGVQERLQAAERERAVALVRAGEERKRRKVRWHWRRRSWGCSWAAARSLGGATRRPRPAGSATPATPRRWPRSWASASRRSGPMTPPRPRSPWRRPGSGRPRVGPKNRRSGCVGSARTWPSCASWTPSTGSAGPRPIPICHPRRLWRRGRGPRCGGSGPTPMRRR